MAVGVDAGSGVQGTHAIINPVGGLDGVGGLEEVEGETPAASHAMTWASQTSMS
jgi:hypothetical protein